MKLFRRSRARARAGHTIIEAAIVATIMVILAGSLAQTSGAVRVTLSGGSVEDQLQANALHAITRITQDLKASGFVAAGGPYPYLFDHGNAVGGFSNHAHTPAVKSASEHDYDFGDDREIVFVRPADDDGDGVPDVDGNGDAVWGDTEFSYVLVTVDGVNTLQRRTDGANGVDIARYVERVTFDDQASAGSEVPVQSVRVRLFFRRPDAQGKVYKYSVETMVKLRNQ